MLIFKIHLGMLTGDWQSSKQSKHKVSRNNCCKTVSAHQYENQVKISKERDGILP